MLQRTTLNASIASALNDYPEIAERWQAGDPTITALMTSIRELVIALSRDNDVNIIEPFIKSKDRTIIADAINKGILPVATPCQHILTVENTGTNTVTLSQGRIIEDGTGRQWRLLSSLTVAPDETRTVVCEQSIVSALTANIALSEPFYQIKLPISDEAYLAGISITNKTQNKPFVYTPKFMNARRGDAVYTLITDDLSSIGVMFGDSARIGQTVQAGEVYEFKITQTYGYVDASTLKQAALGELLADDERYLNAYFKYGGLVRSGANPLNVSQLRLLASFPATYDQNAVFMGNFDMLVRWHFMSRFAYMAIWNETINERFYGASLDSINRMNLTVVANNPADQAQLVLDIQRLVAKADSLLDGRVRVMPVAERPYQITINGSLAGVHDTDSVKTQIKELLLANYGKGSVAASHPNSDGFNRQEIATLIRNTVPEFQDRISDFAVLGEDTYQNPIKPHEWAYLTRDSIHINLVRTADAGNSVWTI